MKDRRDSYSVSDLSKHTDSEFVRNAYRAIYRRDPDPQGFTHYLQRLRHGDRKSEILGSMRYSKEGRQNKVVIRGLLVRYILESSFRIPVIGLFLEIVVSVVMLPKTLRYIRQCEAMTNLNFAEQRDEAKSSCLVTKPEMESTELKAAMETIEAIKAQISTKADASVLENRIAAVISGVNAQLAAKADANALNLLNERQQEIVRQTRDHKANILEQQRRLSLLLEEARKRFPELISQQQLETMLKEEDHHLDAMYTTFEDRNCLANCNVFG